MSNLYKVNASNIIGGAGRLVWVPYGTPAPTKISDVMDTSTFELKPSWKDVGATTEGIEVTRGFETEDFEVDQVKGAIDTEITNWTHNINTQLAENTVENRQLALIGSPIIETPPELGTSVDSSGEVGVNGTIVTFAAAPGADFKEGGYLKIGTEVIKINKNSGNSIYLAEPVKKAQPTGTKVYPVKSLGSKRIGYGAVGNVPEIMLANISQKKDGSLYMAVFRKCKVSGDEKTQTFSKAKRVLPLGLQAFAVEGVADNENVYYEIEEVR
ncbi:TPA: hypothetical protein ACOQ5T_004255 [Bacillus cereus]